jgi:hypothetical protein
MAKTIHLPWARMKALMDEFLKQRRWNVNTKFNPEQRRLVALGLLKARPMVVPNTNAIINDTERGVWYNCVTEVAMALAMTPKEGKEFFDNAGVAD